MKAPKRKHPKAEMVNLYVAVGNLRNLTQHLRMRDVREDRVFLDVCNKSGFKAQLRRLVDTHDLVRLPIDPVKSHHGPTALRSFRGRLPAGVMGDQWIEHTGNIVEFDIDEGSPVDVVGTFAHIVQVARNKLRNRKSDPLPIAQRLREAGLRV